MFTSINFLPSLKCKYMNISYFSSFLFENLDVLLTGSIPSPLKDLLPVGLPQTLKVDTIQRVVSIFYDKWEEKWEPALTTLQLLLLFCTESWQC